MRKSIAALILTAALPACAMFPLNEPRTIGEINANYDYIPLDPLEVAVAIAPLDDSATAAQRNTGRYRRCVARRTGKDADVMDALPDQTLRMAVENISGQANAGFAPVVSASASGDRYRVTADSVNTDEVNVPFAIQLRDAAGNVIPMMSRVGALQPDDTVEVHRLADGQQAPSGFETFVIPIYVGVGLRLTAWITHRSGKVNLSSLGALAAGVEANRISGTLVVQSLGVFYIPVSQIPTDLNSASIQQALVGLGAVRATLYDHDTGTRPRMVGIANPFRTNDPRLIQAIRSELARLPVAWIPCGAA